MTIEKDKFCRAYGGGEFKIMGVEYDMIGFNPKEFDGNSAICKNDETIISSYPGEIKRVLVSNTWYDRLTFCKRFYMVVE